MSSEKVEVVADQFGLKRLYPKDRLFTGQGHAEPLWCPEKQVSRSVSSAAAAEPKEALAPVGCCEFAADLVYSTLTARFCVDQTFCPARCFGDPAVFVSCPTRAEKLKGKEQ